MSTKSVYSIRIPEKYRNMLREMEDINWQEEIRQSTINLIKEKSKEKLLKEGHELRKHMKKEIDITSLIREDRNAR